MCKQQIGKYGAWAIALAMAAALASCGSGGGGGGNDSSTLAIMTIAGTTMDPSGTWFQPCRQVVDHDREQTLVLNGTSATVTEHNFTTSNSSCDSAFTETVTHATVSTNGTKVMTGWTSGGSETSTPSGLDSSGYTVTKITISVGDGSFHTNWLIDNRGPTYLYEGGEDAGDGTYPNTMESDVGPPYALQD